MPTLVFVNRRRGDGSGIWYSSVPDRGDPGFKPSSMPSGRYQFAAVPLSNNKGIFVGGFGGTGGTPNSETKNELYNFNTNTWTSLAQLPSSMYDHAGIPLSGDRGYFCVNQLSFLYNLNTNTWTSRAPMPTSRYQHAGFPISNDRGIFVGGKTPTDELTGVIERYDSNTNSWSSLGSLGFPRAEHSAIPLEDMTGGIIAMGKTDLFPYFDHTTIYVSAGGWTSQRSSLDSPAALGSAIPLSYNRGIFVGGYQSSDVYTSRNRHYNYNTNSWSVKAFMPYVKVGHAGIPLSNNRGVFAGGRPMGSDNSPLFSVKVYIDV